MADDEVPVRDGKKVLVVGATTFEITDPEVVPVAFADYFTEIRMTAGVVYLTLASSIADGTNTPELRIVSRLRMPYETILNISAALERLVSEATKAKEAAN